MPGQQDGSDRAAKGTGASPKKVNKPSPTADVKVARHSVRTGGHSPMQKPKPAGAVDKTGPSVQATHSIPKRENGSETVANAAPAKHHTVAKTTTAPADEIDHAQIDETSEDCELRCTLQRMGSSRHGAFVRVVDYGVTAEQGTRRTMEDQHTMLAEGIPFFGVYDGHGGTQCAEYLRDNLHTLILSHPDIRTNPEKAIKDSIVKADHDFLQRSEEESNESGSVCAVAFIIDDSLVVGNVGDCEAVLCRNGAPIVLTVRHNLQCNPSEMERVKEAGGKVFHNRVGHPKFNPSVVNLAVTRAIGDAGFKLDEYTDGKPSGIIAVPDTTSIKLSSEDEFLIIGCDGLWDVMSYEEVIDFCGRRFRTGEVAQSITDELAQAALNRGGTDNVTAMLVHLSRKRDASGPGTSSEFYTETAVSTSVRNLADDP